MAEEKATGTMEKKTPPPNPQQQVPDTGDVFTRIEEYVIKNKNLVSGVTLIVIAVVLTGIYYFRFYLPGQEEEAQEQLFKAQQYFAIDSFRLAIHGDGNYFGLLDVANEYGHTNAGRLAHYYLGMSYMRLGDYYTAIEHLKKFKTKEPLTQALAWSALGDAYAETGDMEKGIEYYKKAAAHKPNELLTPFLLLKTGMALELAGNPGEAKKYYEQIKQDFPTSSEAREIDKYIGRAEAKTIE